MDADSLRAAGWRSVDTPSYSATIGTLWARGEGTELTAAFVVGKEQSNEHMGTLHGGALMTFADIALGFAVVTALGAPTCATLQLQIQFVSTARVGELVTCRPEIIRRTNQVVFVRGLFIAHEKPIASAEGIWKVLEPRAKTNS